MQDKKIIIGLVGEIAAGKGTVADYLRERHRASYYRFSAMLYDILNRLHLPIDRDNLPALSLALRQAFGQDIFAQVVQKEAEKDESKIVVIDGVRREEDLKFLKMMPEFKLVFVTADIKTRYERLVGRGEKVDDRKSFDEFVRDHDKETELEILAIGERADYRVDNSGSIEDLHAQIEDILAKEMQALT